MTISVKSTDLSDGDPVWLDQLGQVTTWRHTNTFPGGDTSATFNFIAEYDLTHRALYEGRRIRAYSGCELVWSGRLEQPTRGAPWSMTATGMAALASDYGASSSSNIYNDTNGVVDAAIARGLPWQRTASLVNPGDTLTHLSYSDSVDSVLGQLVPLGYYWRVDRDGYITTTPVPDLVKYVAYALETPGGRTFTNYFNSVGLVYVDATSGVATSLLVPGDAGQIARYGVVDKLIDLTILGPISAASATSTAAGMLLEAAAGPGWSDTLTLGAGQLQTLGGAYPDLATLRAGMTASIAAINPDTSNGGSLFPAIPFGQVDYDDVTYTVQLTPLVSARDDLQSMLIRAGLQ